MSRLISSLGLALVTTLSFGLGGCGKADEPESTELVGADEEVESTADALTGSRPVGSTLQTNANLNLRSGPSTNDQILLTMPRGSTVSVVTSQPSGAWYQVKYGSRTGWAHGNYLFAPNATDTGSGDNNGGGTSSTVRVGGGPVVAHAQRFVNDACGRHGCPYELGTRNGHDPSRTRAVDMMMARYNTVAGGAERTRGDQIASFAIDNERSYKLYYVIWRQRINSADGRGWRGMSNRGSNTQNHQDHVHVAFDP